MTIVFKRDLPPNPGPLKKLSPEEKAANESAYIDALTKMATDQINHDKKATVIEEVEGEFAIKTPGKEWRPATEGEVIYLLATLADPDWYKAGHAGMADGMDYKRVYTTVDQNPDYVTLLLADPKQHGMAVLRKIFPDGEADQYNLVLFSTDGIHGGCMTIEDYMAEPDPEEKGNGITFSYIQPRLAHIRIGQCYPITSEDYEFLKKLRQSSWDVLANIGKP